MTKEQKKISEDIMRFIVKHGVSVYSNMVSIPISGDEDIEFQNLIGAFNYCGGNSSASRRLPVIVQDGEHLGRFFIQYTNHNYVSGYKNLEANEVFPLNGDEYLVASGSTIEESLSILWEKVDGNLGKFSSVTYSEESGDILNNLSNE